METDIVTIYKILPDFEHYCAFTLPMTHVLQVIGKTIPATKLMHFYKHNLYLKGVWADIAATFEPVEGVATTDKIPDVTVWVPGTLVLSTSAVETLGDIEDYGELLPVETPAGRYWILNCMRQINADEQYSANITNAGQVLDVETLQFRDEEANRAGLFKTPFDGYRNVFCSQELKDSIQQAKLGGLKFSDQLVSGRE